MDERQEYLDRMARARGYVLPYHKVMVERDLDALRAVNGLIEAVYLRERTLDRRTKELLFVLALTVMRSERGHIKSHIRAALDAGASEAEVLEAMEISLPAAGVVAFQHGFDAFREVTGATGLEPGVGAYDADAAEGEEG